jgi:hypothetical protein
MYRNSARVKSMTCLEVPMFLTASVGGACRKVNPYLCLRTALTRVSAGKQKPERFRCRAAPRDVVFNNVALATLWWPESQTFPLYNSGLRLKSNDDYVVSEKAAIAP